MQISIRKDEIRKRKLFVATPMYGGMCHGLFSRSISDLTAMCKHHDIDLNIYYLFNESLITRARNYCADEFMRSGYTHMMFIDADIGFNPKDVLSLLALQSDDSPYDIIGGAYPKKCISWEKIKMAVDKGHADKNPNELERFVGDFVFNLKGGTQSIPIHAPAEVLEIGTGFMMIRRKTFEVMNEQFPEMLYTPDHVRTEHFDGSRQIMAYFQDPIDNTDFGKIYKGALENIKILAEKNDVAVFEEIKELANKALESKNEKSNRLLSEDYFFCQKTQEAGLKTWLCPWMKLNHVGTYIFGGSLPDMAQLGAHPTADGDQLNAIKKKNKK